MFQAGGGEPAGAVGGFPWSHQPAHVMDGSCPDPISPALLGRSYSRAAQSNTEKKIYQELLQKATRVQMDKNLQFLKNNLPETSPEATLSQLVVFLYASKKKS